MVPCKYRRAMPGAFLSMVKGVTLKWAWPILHMTMLLPAARSTAGTNKGTKAPQNSPISANVTSKLTCCPCSNELLVQILFLQILHRKNSRSSWPSETLSETSHFASEMLGCTNARVIILASNKGAMVSTTERMHALPVIHDVLARHRSSLGSSRELSPMLIFQRW